MLSSDVSLFTAGVYAVAALGLTVHLRTIPSRLRPYCYMLVAVVGLAGVVEVLSLHGIGIYQVNGGTFEAVPLANDILAYIVVFGLTVLLANPSRRVFGIAVAAPVISRTAFDLARLVEGALMAIAAIVAFGGIAFTVYFYLRWVWSAAQRVPDKQRLLHWKCRNLVLFVIVMTATWGLLWLTVLSDYFVFITLASYVSVLLRVGFAMFFFANVEVLAGEGAALEIGDVAVGRLIEDASVPRP